MSAQPSVFVTGGVGFIGSALCRELTKHARVTASVRTEADLSRLRPDVDGVVIADIAKASGLEQVLEGVDVVVHLAARVHVLHEHEQDPLAAFRATNVRGTINLARAAVAAGVSHFVFVSTVGVNGGNSGDSFFQETDEPRPHSAYAQSKLEAELALHEIIGGTGMILTTFRPPLVYGPTVPGNLGRLVAAVRAGIPLPLASVRNERSFVFVENLVDAITNVVRVTPISNEVFFVADEEAISTPELVRLIGDFVGRRARLFGMPVFALRVGGRVAGRSREIEQLVMSLKVSIEKMRTMRNWQPPFSIHEGLRLSLTDLATDVPGVMRE